MDTIANGHVVEIEYTLKNNDGVTLDTSKGNSPLEFIMGKQNVIPGLESALVGKSLGENFHVSIKPEDAYGQRFEQMVQVVPKSEFGMDTSNIEVGAHFQLQDQSGQMILATAIEISDDTITLDGNHPLAGETLNFDVEVVKFRQATEDELSNGIKKESSCCSSESGCC